MEYRKYELNKDKIPEFIDDLINLDDWFPFVIAINHSTLYYDWMQNAKDRSALSKKQYDHVAIREEYQFNHEYIEEVDDWEIEEFLNKYPKFKPLFKVNNEFEYGGYKNKYQRNINLVSKLLIKIFSF